MVGAVEFLGGGRVKNKFGWGCYLSYCAYHQMIAVKMDY